MIRIPEKFPRLKGITILLGIFAVTWISLEGRLPQIVLMGVGVTAVSMLHLMQNKLGGREIKVGSWVGLTAVFGTLAGLISVGITLIFMAVKTGLHGHGPEFTLAEIEWIIQQLPLWGTIGLLCGSAIGFISAGRASR